MKKQSPIVQKASEYVFNLMREKLPANHIYHNYNHTVDVVEASIEIAEGIDLSKEDTEIVVLGAWFHDTGFVETYEGHEEQSQQIASQFLHDNLYPEEKIEKVLGCIAATRYPQQPGEVGIDRMHRHAGHHDGLACALAARRQGHVEQPIRLARVVVEELVEIAHPVEDERVRMLGLDAQVLRHGRRVA